jgi:DNA polymerase III delta prime subunit
MRLVNLTIRNFRGFGSTAESIPLDGDLLLFYGPNGFGKTSLAEAIEWLFYGTTKRRQQGDGYSRSEYANSFANVHGGVPTEVTATVEVGGRRVVLLRRLGAGETSETFVDNVPAAFSSINVAPIEAFYPVVAQHGLQTFVHAKPKERRDAICAAFGLDELTALKNALDSARASFQRMPPGSATEARRELAANARVLLEIPETQRLAQRWRLTPLQLDLEADVHFLISAASALTGAECLTVNDALASLREARQKASRSVFDAQTIAPLQGIEPLASSAEAVKQVLSSVETSIGAAVAATASTYKSAFLEFWRAGFELSPSGDRCPMCEADTLTAVKRAEIAKRLADNAALLQKVEALRAAVGVAKTRIATYRAQANEFGSITLNAEEAEHLRQLFGEDANEVDAFCRRWAHLTLCGGQKEKFSTNSTRFSATVSRSLKFQRRSRRSLGR